jgi:hypothetical protein
MSYNGATCLIVHAFVLWCAIQYVLSHVTVACVAELFLEFRISKWCCPCMDKLLHIPVNEEIFHLFLVFDFFQVVPSPFGTSMCTSVIPLRVFGLRYPWIFRPVFCHHRCAVRRFSRVLTSFSTRISFFTGSKISRL